MMKFLSAKEVEKSVDLDPNKNYDDFDVFIAVAKVQLSCFTGELVAGDDVNECNRGVDSHEHPLGIMDSLKKDMANRSKVRGEGGFDTKKAPIHKYNWSPPDLELKEKMKIKREKVFNELVNSQEGVRTKRARRSLLRFEEEVEEPVKSEECVRSKRVPKRPLRFEENVEEEEEQMAIPIKRRAYNRVVIEDSSEDSEKHDVKRPKKKSKGKKKEEIKLPDPSPDMSDELKRRIVNIGGTDIQLLITKSLTSTDCKKGQQRLSMPKSQVVADFLKENEKAIIEANNNIPVKLIQPNFEETDINFKKWIMEKKSGRVSNLYVLKKPWNDVVKRNGFEVGNIIQVWSFRVDGKLRFAIVRLP